MNDTIPFPPSHSVSDPTIIGRPRLADWRHARPAAHAHDRDDLTGVSPHELWLRLRDYLPHDLSGYTALDVGCAHGAFSIELARRGAEVTAIEDDPLKLQAAHTAITEAGLLERIRLFQGTVYDLARWDKQHDIVLFLDIFRRVRYPTLALDIAARIVKRCFVFETVTVPGHEVEFAPVDLPLDQRPALARPGWPKVAFVEHAFAGQPSTWWVPNRAATEAMLRSAGLGIVARPVDDVYVCQPRGLESRAGERVARERDAATGLVPAGPTPFGSQPAPEEIAPPESGATIEPAA